MCWIFSSSLPPFHFSATIVEGSYLNTGKVATASKVSLLSLFLKNIISCVTVLLYKKV